MTNPDWLSPSIVEAVIRIDELTQEVNGLHSIVARMRTELDILHSRLAAAGTR